MLLEYALQQTFNFVDQLKKRKSLDDLKLGIQRKLTQFWYHGKGTCIWLESGITISLSTRNNVNFILETDFNNFI